MLFGAWRSWLRIQWNCWQELLGQPITLANIFLCSKSRRVFSVQYYCKIFMFKDRYESFSCLFFAKKVPVDLDVFLTSCFTGFKHLKLWWFVIPWSCEDTLKCWVSIFNNNVLMFFYINKLYVPVCVRTEIMHVILWFLCKDWCIEDINNK